LRPAILTVTTYAAPPPRDDDALPTRRSSDLSEGNAQDVKATVDVIKSFGDATLTIEKDETNASKGEQLLNVTLTASKASTKNGEDRKSTRLNSSHVSSSYAVFCLKQKNNIHW